MFWWLRLQETWMGLTHRKTNLPRTDDRSQRQQESISVLLVSQDEALRHSLCALGHVYRWEILTATTREMAIEILKLRQMPLVICDEDAPEDWKKTIRSIAFLPQSTCILLASHNAGEVLQKEVRKHHGYDAIAKPLRFQEVADRVSFAWAWYKSGCASWWGPPQVPSLTPPFPGSFPGKNG